MPGIVITITDHTQPGARLSDLVNGVAVTGFTVDGGVPGTSPNNQYWLIQHAFSTGANLLYLGRAADKCTDSTAFLEIRKGDDKTFFPGDGNAMHLNEVFLNSDVDGAKVRLSWFYR